MRERGMDGGREGGRRGGMEQRALLRREAVNRHHFRVLPLLIRLPVTAFQQPSDMSHMSVHSQGASKHAARPIHTWSNTWSTRQSDRAMRKVTNSTSTIWQAGRQTDRQTDRQTALPACPQSLPHSLAHLLALTLAPPPSRHLLHPHYQDRSHLTADVARSSYMQG